MVCILLHCLDTNEQVSLDVTSATAQPAHTSQSVMDVHEHVSMATEWGRGFQGLHPLSKFNEISKHIQAYTVNRAVPEDGV